MKRTIRLICAVLLIGSLCACGNEAYDTTPSGWVERFYTDPFGDSTGKAYLYGEFSGSFSSVWESSAPLTVAVYGEDTGFSFLLLEYGHHRFTPEPAESVTFSAKLGAAVTEAPLQYEEEKLVLSDFAVNSALRTALEQAESIPCIITAGSRKYTFTLTAIDIT